MNHYVLTGKYFRLIPNDAVGVIATENDSPLGWLNSQLGLNVFDIVEKSDTSLELAVREAAPHSGNTYLGAIVSPDRQTVYWVNNSKPLP